MMKNNFYASIIITFILGMSIAYANPTLIYVDPGNVKDAKLTPGNKFTVNIKIDGVASLCGYDFKLSWDSNLLSVDSAKGTPGNLFSDNLKWKDEVTTDTYWVAYTIHDSSVSCFSGSTTLATITFKVNNIGSSTLHIFDTLMGDFNANSISYEVKDGVFDNSGSCGYPNCADCVKNGCQWCQRNIFGVDILSGCSNSCSNIAQCFLGSCILNPVNCPVEDQCTSGPCCDIATKKFKPSITVCNENFGYNYVCKDGTGCGKDVYQETTRRYCSGSSSDCNGQIVGKGDYVVFKDCTNTQICTLGNPPTCKAEPSCYKTTGTCEERGGVECFSGSSGCSMTCKGMGYKSGVCNLEEDNGCYPGDCCCYCTSAPTPDQCTSGLCCNITTKPYKFQPSTTVCNPSTTEYGCPWGTACDNDIGKRTGTQYCSGSSADCTGYVSWNSWTVDKTCASTEKCTPGNPATCDPCSVGATTTTTSSTTSTTQPSTGCCCDASNECVNYGNCCGPGKAYICVSVNTCERIGQGMCCEDGPSSCPSGQTCYVTLTTTSSTTSTTIVGGQCTSGLCCDTTTKKFKPSTTICGSPTEYRCSGTACGDNAEKRTGTQYCSGSSADCTGAITWNSWTVYKDCLSTEKCALATTPGNPPTCNICSVGATTTTSSTTTTSTTIKPSTTTSTTIKPSTTTTTSSTTSTSTTIKPSTTTTSSTTSTSTTRTTTTTIPLVGDQCTSGPCCDTTTKKFRPSSYPCGSTTEYGCPWTNACGYDVGIRTNTIYCPGNAATCTGTTILGSWTVAAYCDSTQTCSLGVSTCNYNSSCVTPTTTPTTGTCEQRGGVECFSGSSGCSPGCKSMGYKSGICDTSENNGCYPGDCCCYCTGTLETPTFDLLSIIRDFFIRLFGGR